MRDYNVTLFWEEPDDATLYGWVDNHVVADEPEDALAKALAIYGDPRDIVSYRISNYYDDTVVYLEVKEV